DSVRDARREAVSRSEASRKKRPAPKIANLGAAASWAVPAQVSLNSITRSRARFSITSKKAASGKAQASQGAGVARCRAMVAAAPPCSARERRRRPIAVQAELKKIA